MKIILCKGQFLGPVSGADEILVNYAAHLKSSGYSVSVLLLYPFSHCDPYYVRLREAGVSVKTIAPSSTRAFLSIGRTIARSIFRVFPSSEYFIRRKAQRVATNLASSYYEQCQKFLETSNADAVHVLTPDPGAVVLISAAHAAGIPVIYQEVGIPYHPPAYKSYYEQFTSVLPLCAEVAALSPSLARECQEKLPCLNKFSVLPLIVSDEHDIQLSSHTASNTVNIGFAGRIEHLKGPLVLLDAFAEVYQKSSNVRLIIAGNGLLQEKFITRASFLGVAPQCEYAGVYKGPEQRHAFMQRLDIFALPSLTEGTPNSIIEAMSHGIPIVASAVGGIPDVVTADTGILVPPGEIAPLAEAIAKLAADPTLRARMGRAAHERYKKLFSPKVVLPLILNTYQRVVSRNAEGETSLTVENGQGHPWAASA